MSYILTMYRGNDFVVDEVGCFRPGSPDWIVIVAE